MSVAVTFVYPKCNVSGVLQGINDMITQAIEILISANQSKKLRQNFMEA